MTASALIERLRDYVVNDPYTTELCREAADALTDLEARLRIAEKRAEDAEARNDFLITELDELIRKAKQT
jgi:phage baseplate assembly protein W